MLQVISGVTKRLTVLVKPAKRIQDLNMRFTTEKKQKFFRCVQDNHQPNECYYSTETCHGCGKVRHLKRDCKKTKHIIKAQMITANGETLHKETRMKFLPN